jgi:hypothetical protein
MLPRHSVTHVARRTKLMLDRIGHRSPSRICSAQSTLRNPQSPILRPSRKGVRGFRCSRVYTACNQARPPGTFPNPPSSLLNPQSITKRCSGVPVSTCSRILQPGANTQHIPQSTIHHPPSTIHNPQSTIPNPQSPIHNPQSTIPNPPSPESETAVGVEKVV